MNIIYLLFHGLSPYSGISKKILHQVKGFEACGHRVSLCTYSIADNDHRVRMINNEIIEDYGTGKPAAAKRRVSYQCIYRYAVTHQVELIYVRSFHNANPFTIRLFSKLRKAGIKIAMEIPTYPYDSEYAGFPLVTRLGIQVDKVFRKTLAKHVNAIVTFSDYHCIFGQRTIQISNGVDFDSIPLKKTVSKKYLRHSSTRSGRSTLLARLRPSDRGFGQILPKPGKHNRIFPHRRRYMEIRNA